MNHKLLAGASKCSITPDDTLLPMPFVGPVTFDFIKDSIFVRALYLENPETKLLIMTFDLGEVPYPEETRAYIQEITGLPKETIFLAGTHTHETPFMSTASDMLMEDSQKEIYHRYFEQIKDAIKKAITDAMGMKCPARLGFGKGSSYINVNRDEPIDGKAEVGNNYERPSDKTLRLMRIEALDGKLIALLINYAVHGVLLNGNFVNDKLYISGDIPGQASTMLEAKLGGIALWTSAAAGDQNPRVMTNFGYINFPEDLRTKCVGEGAFYLLDSLVSEHVRDIIKVNNQISCVEESPEIKALDETVFVEGAQGQPVPYELFLVKIGNTNLLGINAEVVTSIGAAICHTSKAENTLLITHVLGSAGYVCDDWQYQYQSFETGMAAAKQGAAEPAFVNAFTEMQKNL